MSSSQTPAPHHVQQEEVLDWQTYSDDRDSTRATVMELKKSRRIHLGDNLTFLFENHDTIWYQIQEIMRAERIVRESGIREELDIYNSMLGGPGQLGCALLIEIEVGQDRLSAVQYLVFALPDVPVRLGSDFAALELVVDLDEAQQTALAADLAATLG